MKSMKTKLYNCLTRVFGHVNGSVGGEGEADLHAGSLMTLTIAGVNVDFRWAPAGKFLMGIPESAYDHRRQWYSRSCYEIQHEVKLTQGFWIAETPTTQELWQAVMGDNPSCFTGDGRLPVESVSWDDCQEFVFKLIYNYSASVPIGFKYSLPTEAQWEYACRAGTTTAFNFGSTLNGDMANCNGKRPFGTYKKGARLRTTTAVKSYPPNAWGLYDMHGNVCEWLSDLYNSHYDTEPSRDPIILDKGWKRVQRGGSWDSDAEMCQSAYRRGRRPDIRNARVGFRLVLAPCCELQPGQIEVVVAQREYPNGDEPDETRAAGAVKTFEIADVPVRFHWAPAGRFLMGSAEREPGHCDDEIQREVTLRQGFWIAETPTTQELWQSVMGNNPSHFKGHEQLPVDGVSWQACYEFVDKLNNSYSSTLPIGYKYALPTDAQWEYACRAGTTTPFNFGDSLNGDKANCAGIFPYGTSRRGGYITRTTPVRSYPPNAWGLYDMHGNVWEMTACGLRGGSWQSYAVNCRSATRTGHEPYHMSITCGFRLVLVPISQSEPVIEDVVTGHERVNDNESDFVDLKAGSLLKRRIAGVEVNFHWAPAGTMTGSPKCENGRLDKEKQYEVELTQGFWIAETPTTQELWQAVMGIKPGYGCFGDNIRLVCGVSWNECQTFITALNSKHVRALPEGYKYAMPTEAQWEYACRAGLYEKSSGLLEWCADRYHEWYYANVATSKDPIAAEKPSDHERVLRGGLYSRRGGLIGGETWDGLLPDDRSGCGLRLVLVANSPPFQRKRYLHGDDPIDTRVAGAIKTLEIADVQVNFHWAPAGTFLMGSPESEIYHWVGETQHEVTLSQGFWIAETQTTQELWQAVTGNNPSYFKGHEQRPVERISWNDCQMFLELLNRNHASVLPDGYIYAMPTDAQWEYACRAGTTTPFNYGSTLDGDMANCNSRYGFYSPNIKRVYLGTTTRVRSYPPNAWGLYDMHGNVCEWCADWYDMDYDKNTAQKDPTGPSSGSVRVLRGGSWFNHVEDCRSAVRIYNEPEVRSYMYGFRLVLAPCR